MFIPASIPGVFCQSPQPQPGPSENGGKGLGRGPFPCLGSGQGGSGLISWQGHPPSPGPLLSSRFLQESSRLRQVESALELQPQDGRSQDVRSQDARPPSLS